MPRVPKVANETASWNPIPDPEGHYSTGTADFDRLIGGGFKRGSFALFEMSDTVGPEDIDLLFFPTLINFLYQSRGVLAVLPSVDSPHNFRSRMVRFVTRRRFDSRVRIVDYIGEDEGPAYVVSLKNMRPDPLRRSPINPKELRKDIAKMEAAEKAVQGQRKRSFLEFHAIEVLDTLVGGEKARKMYFSGVKRARAVHNLVIGLLAPGVECAAAVRSMADTKFALRREEMGLIIQGLRPSFPSYVVTADLVAGPPHVAFVPSPS